MMHIRWVPPSGHFGRNPGRPTARPHLPPQVGEFYWLATDFFIFGSGGLDVPYWAGSASWTWLAHFW